MLGYLVYALRRISRFGANAHRRLRRPPPYVGFLLEGSYPDLPEPRAHILQRWLGPPPRLSLHQLGEAFRMVAGDPRVRGVVLHLRPLAMSLAQLQTLRGLVADLGAAGKRVVAWATRYDTPTYYVACAADEVLLQPGGDVAPLGVRQHFTFLADALAGVGLKAEVIPIGPYKTAYEGLTRREMSQQAREMADWVADSLFADLLDAVRQGRRLADVQVARSLVDGSPYTDLEALKAGVVDALVHEEDLPAYLGSRGRPARLAPWDQARRRLLRPRPPSPGRYVALIRIDGVIVDGHSRRPPLRLGVPLLFEPRTGDITVVEQARRALQDRRAAAVLVAVNSGGGSAIASEAIAAALARLAVKKPVVVWMSTLAASGGYYVSAPARWIVAQPATLTGSIGVLSAKVVDAGILQRLGLNRQAIVRGRRALMHAFDRPFTPEEREWVMTNIQRIYQLFVDRVAAGRRLTPQAVDQLGGGRVWTGRQALEHGLVDELGGLEQALRRARELARLDPWAPVREVPAGRGPVSPAPPESYGAAGAGPLAARLAGGLLPLAGIWQAREALDEALGVAALIASGRPMCLCPLVWGQPHSP